MRGAGRADWISSRSSNAGSGSQLGAELALTAYSVVAGFVLVRSLLLSVGVSGELWVGSFVYRVTDPLVLVFELVPGGDVEIAGMLTLADLTLLALVTCLPFFVLARTRGRW